MDPALSELNTRLGEARGEIQRAAEKGWEAWDAGQQKTQQSVEALQKSAAKAAKESILVILQGQEDNHPAIRPRASAAQ